MSTYIIGRKIFWFNFRLLSRIQLYVLLTYYESYTDYALYITLTESRHEALTSCTECVLNTFQ